MPTARAPAKPWPRAVPLLIVALLTGCTSLADCGRVRRPNVLLITIDTLRADHVGAYGSRTAKTPVIDRLAADGLRFERAFTSVPVTLASHATLLTGRLPFQHGVHGNSFYTLPPDQPTLAELLKRAGYSTAAAVGAAVLDHRFGLNRGFDLYDDETTSGSGATFIAERDATTVVSRASSWLTGNPVKRPFFLWVHLFDPHDPYRPPEPFATEFAGSPYDGEIAYVDRELGRLFATLRSTGDWSRTLVVFAADHGESLGAHGEATHGIFLYDDTVRVPLILAGPGIPHAVRDEADPAGLVDVLPTILARLGITPPVGMAGRDVLARPAAPREFLYMETLLPRDFYNWSGLRGLRSARTKFVAAPTPELYDLVADPAERRNLAAREPGEVRRLAAVLDSIAGPAGAGPESHASADPDLAERIRSLGYVAGGPLPQSDRGSQPAGPDPKSRIQVVARMDQALALVHAKDLPRAVEALRAILADDPGNYLAAHSLADALFDLSRDDEAIEAYRRALTSGRGAAYYHYRLGLLHERRHEYGNAAGEFAQVIQYNPAAAREVLARGDQLLATGATAGALAYFEMLRAAGSGGPALSVRLADARLRAGQVDGAVAGLREAIRQHPDVPELRDTLVRALGLAGAARGDAGDLSGATAAFREALTVAPADFDSLANLGLTELRAGRPGAALEALTRALAVRPNEVRLLNVTAEIRFRRREYAAAHDLLVRSLAIDPKQPRILEALRAVERASPRR